MKKIYNYCFTDVETEPSTKLNYDIPYNEQAYEATVLALLQDIKQYLKVLTGKK